MGTRAASQQRLRRKTARAVRALEAHFGVPERGPPRPLLDSLVQTILSQSTSDRNSGRAFRSLRERFPTWEAALAAGPGEIEAAIRSGGLARQKSVRIHKLLRWVREESGSLDLSPLRQMPTEEVFAALLPLEGVGVKTVAVVLLFACGRDCFAVDTHVHRIVRRLGLVGQKATAEKTFERMRPLVPEGKAHSFHVNLLRLGRTLCRPRGPRCPECPLRRLCDYARQASPRADGDPT
ncbi:MAG: endonuclease III domain-containing protein [Candidatus Brocadiia bacterium]